MAALHPLRVFLVLLLAGAGCTAPAAAEPTPQEMAAGCATCVYGMEGIEGCVLAVLVDGRPLLVTGVPIPGHETGICDREIRAQVAGRREGDRFVATSFAAQP